MVDITGKKDAMHIKQEYQNALNHSHKELKKQVGLMYKINHKIKYAINDALKYKRDIEASLEEKHELYKSLFNLLKDEKGFEGLMMDKAQKGKKGTKVSIQPKIKDSDIDELKINAMQEYIDKYPDPSTKKSYENLQSKIAEKEKEITKVKEKMHKELSVAKREANGYMPRNIKHSRNKLKRFRDQLKEGVEELKSMRYIKGIAYKLSSRKERLKVTIDTKYYRDEENEEVIKNLEGENKDDVKEIKELEKFVSNLK